MRKRQKVKVLKPDKKRVQRFKCIEWAIIALFLFGAFEYNKYGR